MAGQLEKYICSKGSWDVSITDPTGRSVAPSFGVELVISKVPGREGYKTDMRSMQEFNQRRADSLELIRFLRGGYASPQIHLNQMFELSSAMLVLPVYIVLRASNPGDEDQIPPSVIDTARAAAGVARAINAMLEDTPGEIYKSPDEVYEFANGKNRRQVNYFIKPGDTSLACPAPERSVKEVLHAMTFSSDMPQESITHDWRTVITDDERTSILEFGWLFRTCEYYVGRSRTLPIYEVS